MSNYTDDDWEKLGIAWRKAASLNDKIFNGLAFVRWLKHSGRIKNYILVPRSELPNAEGKYDPNNGCLYYVQNTWDLAEASNSTAMWSVVHEASHYILDHQEIRFRAHAHAQNRHSYSVNRDESHANRLTASLIAPYDLSGFKLGMTVYQIAKLFNLSHHAATKRLTEFERIFRAKNNIPRKLPPGIVDFLAAQQRKGYRVTSLGELYPAAAETYEGDACPNCGAFKLVRTGLARRCGSCEAVLGDD